MNAVRYPACPNRTPIVFFEPRAAKLSNPVTESYTSVSCGYMPVRYVARDGQHNGFVTKLFVNVIPRSAISLRVRGMASQYGRNVASKSSTTRRTTFGCRGDPISEDFEATQLDNADDNNAITETARNPPRRIPDRPRVT